MNKPAGKQEMLDLVCGLINDRLTPEQSARLESLVTGDVAARRLYLEMIDLAAGLEWGEGARFPQPEIASSAVNVPSVEQAAEMFGVDLAARRPSALAPVRSWRPWVASSSLHSVSLVACVYYLLVAGLFYSLSLGLREEHSAVPLTSRVSAAS